MAFKDRHEAHAALARVLAEGQYPRACCREDPNAEFPYQVWTDDQGFGKESA